MKKIYTSIFSLKVFLLISAVVVSTSSLQAQLTLIKDIRSGNLGSSPQQMVVFNNKIIFQANNGVVGSELWASDGTENGTLLLKDINVGTTTTSSTPMNFAVLNNKLYFRATEGAVGAEVFVYDGTDVSLFYDLKTGGTSSNPAVLVANTNNLLIKASDPVTTDSRWYITDGTAMPVVLVLPDNTEIVAGISSVVYNNQFYFSAGITSSSYQLYKYDGNVVSLVKTINTTGSSSISGLTVSNGKIYFSATDGINGNELWTSDGTETGTFMVKNIASGSVGSTPTNFYSFQNKLYFSANDGINNTEPWVSDGTEAGTNMLKNINTKVNTSTSTPELTYGSSPNYFCEAYGKLYFQASHPSYGAELWVTDGTEAGTKLEKDIFEGVDDTYSSGVSDLKVLNGILYFSATEGATKGIGKELYKYVPTDPSLASTETAVKKSRVFPNPSKGEFMISNVKNVNYKIFSLDGKLLYTGLSSDGKISTGLKTGTYIMTYQDGKELVSNKIIINQ